MRFALRTLHAASCFALSGVTLVAAATADFRPADSEVVELVAGSSADGSIRFTHHGIDTRITRGWPQQVLMFSIQVSNGADASLGIRDLDLWIVTDTGTVLSEPQLRQNSVAVDRVDVAAGEDARFDASFYLGPTGPFDGFTLYWGARLGSRVIHGNILYEADGAGYQPPDGRDIGQPAAEKVAGEGEPGEDAYVYVEDGVYDDAAYGNTYVYYDTYGYYPGFTFGLHYGYYPFSYYGYGYYSYGQHHDGHHYDDGHHSDDGHHAGGRHGGHYTGDHARDSGGAVRTRSGSTDVATRSRDSAGRSGLTSRTTTRSRASRPAGITSSRSTVSGRGSSAGRSGSTSRTSSRSSSHRSSGSVRSSSGSRSRPSSPRTSSRSSRSSSRGSHVSRGSSRSGGSHVSRGSSRSGGSHASRGSSRSSGRGRR